MVPPNSKPSSPPSSFTSVRAYVLLRREIMVFVRGTRGHHSTNGFVYYSKCLLFDVRAFVQNTPYCAPGCRPGTHLVLVSCHAYDEIPEEFLVPPRGTKYANGPKRDQRWAKVRSTANSCSCTRGLCRLLRVFEAAMCCNNAEPTRCPATVACVLMLRRFHLTIRMGSTSKPPTPTASSNLGVALYVGRPGENISCRSCVGKSTSIVHVSRTNPTPDQILTQSLTPTLCLGSLRSSGAVARLRVFCLHYFFLKRPAERPALTNQTNQTNQTNDRQGKKTSLRPASRGRAIPSCM